MRFTRIKKNLHSLFGFLATRFGGSLFKSSPDLSEDAGQADGGSFGKAPDRGKNDEPGFLTNTFRHILSSTKGHIGSLNSRVFIDELTSVSNKGGYDIYIRDMQDRMDVSKEKLEFAVAVFDCDNLKSINENYGHEKGDLYLKTASRLICRIFAMSPVFRIGGDEFSVILQDVDFLKNGKNCSACSEKRRKRCVKHL